MVNEPPTRPGKAPFAGALGMALLLFLAPLVAQVINAPAARAFTVTDHSCGCTWSLTNHNGTVFSGPLAAVGRTWLAPGAYVLTVTDGTPGTYGFKVWAVPDPQSFAI